MGAKMSDDGDEGKSAGRLERLRMLFCMYVYLTISIPAVGPYSICLILEVLNFCEEQRATSYSYLAMKMTEFPSIIATALLSFALPSVFAAPKVYKTNDTSPDAPSTWPGWHGIKHMIFFGDSYTNTHFDLSGAQPSFENPLGNPPYPGLTSSNGPNYLDFLTTTYNESFIETINLAYSGSVVDAALVTPYLPTVQTLKNQVENEYLPFYSQHPSLFDWKAESTLFSIWIGINDVNLAYSRDNASLTFGLIFEEYTSLVEKLFQSGARNFLFLNIPPIDRCPMTVTDGPDAVQGQKTTIAEWNVNLTTVVAGFKNTHPEATAFLFDTNGLLNGVIDDPCSHSETCALRNTDWYCDAYANGTPDWYTQDPSCEYAVDEYFWLNNLHIGFRVHYATAHEIVKVLDSAGDT